MGDEDTELERARSRYDLLETLVHWFCTTQSNLLNDLIRGEYSRWDATGIPRKTVLRVRPEVLKQEDKLRGLMEDFCRHPPCPEDRHLPYIVAALKKVQLD